VPAPYSWARIVNASRRLTGDQKLVWDQIRLLDNGPDGCFLAPAKLAARCGLELRGLEGIRQRLSQARLLASERRGKRFHWFARLPEPCYPSQRPTEEEILGFAAILDGHVGQPGTEPAHPIAMWSPRAPA